jgi:hypothetical protein
MTDLPIFFEIITSQQQTWWNRHSIADHLPTRKQIDTLPDQAIKIHPGLL